MSDQLSPAALTGALAAEFTRAVDAVIGGVSLQPAGGDAVGDGWRISAAEIGRAHV